MMPRMSRTRKTSVPMTAPTMMGVLFGLDAFPPGAAVGPLVVAVPEMVMGRPSEPVTVTAAAVDVATPTTALE